MTMNQKNNDKEKVQRKNPLLGTFLLFVTTVIWGAAFTAQSSAADKIGSFTFITSRQILASVSLIIIAAIRSVLRRHKIISPQTQNKTSRKRLLIGGILCGITLFLGMSLQQLGISSYPPDAASSGRSGFLTATYVIMIPVVQRITGKKLSIPVILSVFGCLAGMYLLCLSNGFTGIYLGDLLELGCAAGFTSYIIIVDRFNDEDCIFLSIIQSIVSALIAFAAMLLTEKPDIGILIQAWLPIVYAGVLSSGIGYTLQIIGQKTAEPTVASVVMSMESVFAALFGWLILGEILGIRELSGCILVFASVILAQFPDHKNNKTRSTT